MTTATLNAKIGAHRVLVIPVQQPDKNQLDLFSDAKKYWLEAAMEIANTMHTPFWFSELRAKIECEPAHMSWWGALTHKMSAAGFKMTGQFRRSKTGSRKGGVEFQWGKA